MHEDISWNVHEAEEKKYSIEMLAQNNILVFGRVTYEMMISFWTSDEAKQNLPGIAKAMNESDKIVFSKTLQTVEWNNTSLIKDELITSIRQLKQQQKNLTILGSGNIISQLADAGLIDIYQLRIDPVAISAGTTIFNGIHQPIKLKLINSAIAKSGTLLLTYIPF